MPQLLEFRWTTTYYEIIRLCLLVLTHFCSLLDDVASHSASLHIDVVIRVVFQGYRLQNHEFSAAAVEAESEQR